MSGDLTARDVIAHEVHLQVPTLQHGPIGTEFVADAVLAALAAAGWRLERDDQWEWNVRDRWGDLMLNTGVPKDEATGWLDIPQRGRTLVRRRPAGEWEVVK